MHMSYWQTAPVNQNHNRKHYGDGSDQEQIVRHLAHFTAIEGPPPVPVPVDVYPQVFRTEIRLDPPEIMMTVEQFYVDLFRRAERQRSGILHAR
jgi:hypothetical protein